MPQGIQCWNASGVKTLDVTDTISRVIGVMRVNGPGTLDVPDFTNGRPFIIILNENGGSISPAASRRAIIAGITGGTTLTWSRWDGSTSSDYATIIYGLR